MTTRALILLGAGEHARVVAEAASLAEWQVTGYAAPEATDGIPGEWLGDDGAVANRLAATDPAGRPAVVLGFGATGPLREAAVARFGPDTSWAAIVHPAAWVSPSARLEPGVVVLAQAVVNTGATIGPHAIVNSGAIVEHDVVVGGFAHVAPGAVLGGGVVVGERVHVGIGAAVRDHVTIGADAVVGMGAVVVADVPAGTTVVGNPARTVDRR